MVLSHSTVQYRPVRNFSGYWVGSDGTVESRKRGVIRLKPWMMKNGYCVVSLYQKGKKVHWLVHRLVLLHFVGDCPDGMEACHGDGDRSNNCVGNLRWDTRKANQADRHKHGTAIVGSSVPWAKLDEDLVRVVKNRLRCGHTATSIAKDVGVHLGTISDIKRGLTWKHVV